MAQQQAGGGMGGGGGRAGGDGHPAHNLVDALEQSWMGPGVAPPPGQQQPMLAPAPSAAAVAGACAAVACLLPAQMPYPPAGYMWLCGIPSSVHASADCASAPVSRSRMDTPAFRRNLDVLRRQGGVAATLPLAPNFNF